MEKIEFENQLLEAVKKDDVKSFTFLMPTDADLNLCYGRFPLLSLLYLYSSYKILAKFEKKLFPIHNFRIVGERIEIYKEFRRRAKKSLRLFRGEEIIYPILMLAVLDERIIIENKFKFLYKNVEIINKFEKIYKLNHKTNIEIEEDCLDIPNKKLTQSHYVLFGVVTFIFSLIIALSTIFMVFVSNQKGFGSEYKPIKISSSLELSTALGRGERNYLLSADITMRSSDMASYDFSGSLDGSGYTLTIDGEINSSLIKNLSGTIKNLNIKLDNNQIKITQNSAIISEKCSGNIENCAILGNFTLDCSAEEEVFIGLFASENTGFISNCKTIVSGVLSNSNETNAFFGLFVGQNLNGGEISSCVTENGIILADTVDVAGIVGLNEGAIKLTDNKVKISQTSNKQWNPNVAGIAVSNYGTIENCRNLSELSAGSTTETIDGEYEYYVVVGGVACENYGKILNCSNLGEIVGSADILNVIVSGITAQNVKNDDYEAVVKYSLSNSNIKAMSESGQVCAGGLVGINSSVVLYSGSKGSIEANSNSTTNKAVFMNEVDKPLAVVAGGLVGVNQSAVVQNCYSDAQYLNVSESSDVLKIYSGVIGSVGMFKFRIWALINGADAYTSDYTGDALDYVYNNFYVHKDTIKQSAYGIYGTLEQKTGGLYYKSGSSEVLDETLYASKMKKCATFDEIPEEVRANA